jgi:hypothetical protein
LHLTGREPEESLREAAHNAIRFSSRSAQLASRAGRAPVVRAAAADAATLYRAIISVSVCA